MVKTLIDKSMRTKEASVEVGKIVIDVNQDMEKINNISQTIAGITEQTNLLSLNASMVEFTKHADELQNIVRDLESEIGKFKIKE